MSQRTLGILFVILVVLAAVVFLMNQDSGNGAEVDPDATLAPSPSPQVNMVRDATIEDVVRLEVTRLEDDFQVAFVREENGDWFQVVPTDTMVISTTMNSNVTRLINMTSQTVLSAEENPLSVYGLDAPQYEILLVTRREGDNVRHDFTIGSKTPTNAGYYTQKFGDPRIHVLLSSTIESLTGLLDERPIPTPTPEAAETG